MIIVYLSIYVEERPWWPVQAPTKEESERLRGEGGQFKSIDLGFTRRQMVGSRKGRR